MAGGAPSADGSETVEASVLKGVQVPATRAPHAELLEWRREFPILERTTYLISNSLGAMPRGVRDELASFADAWDQRGVRAWGEGWWESAAETGDLLAPILGVSAGEVSMHQNVTLAVAGFLSALDYPPQRHRIVTTALNFPSLLYLLEGERDRGATILSVPSTDGLTIGGKKLLAAIDERTRLVAISHVLFKSGFVQEAAAVARRCHQVGALLLLDIYQSAGVMPVGLVKIGWPGGKLTTVENGSDASNRRNSSPRRRAFVSR
ncbi:MAG: aminotransferase class V-fold PLP-dependent enzyme [Thermoanaerobaculia bacterium]